jgi:hypothetical protein
MPFFRLVCLVGALGGAATPLPAQGQRAAAPIVGTWLLESLVDSLANGAVAYWMGTRPTGAIIYAASGHMSVQFMRDPRPTLPGGGPPEPTRCAWRATTPSLASGQPSSGMS